MNKTTLVVLMTFLIAITPSVSDAEQLRMQWVSNGQEGMHPWKWIGTWYIALLIALCLLWRDINGGR